MSAFDSTQLALSQPFRFGSALAEEANRWLHIVDSPIRLTGTPPPICLVSREPSPTWVSGSPRPEDINLRFTPPNEP